MSTVDEDETETMSKTLESTWNVPGLKKEVVRLTQRCFKKIGKANERLTRAKKTVEDLVSDPHASLEALENCPNVEAFEMELKELQHRIRNLNALDEALSNLGSKKKSMVLPTEIAQLALDLGVDDKPPPRPERKTKKKGPRRDEPSRKPYRRYYSFGNVEIRVGKRAEDNDQLTLSPEHRDGSDWWMHASGCPGSHVVIRYGQQDLPEEVVRDAAALAARQSKCSGSVIKVSLTRCRDIAKPPGAKAGLVLLTGKVRTVSVNMKEAQARLERLEETVKVN